MVVALLQAGYSTVAIITTTSRKRVGCVNPVYAKILTACLRAAGSRVTSHVTDRGVMLIYMVLVRHREGEPSESERNKRRYRSYTGRSIYISVFTFRWHRGRAAATK